jgi:hypothetical protein
VFDTNRWLFRTLKAQLRNQRIYISPAFLFSPAVTLKQGLLNEVNVVDDYESLAVARYGEFFGRVSGVQKGKPFDGPFQLGPQARWGLMDLTATKYYVVQRGEPAAVYMMQQPRFRLILDGFVQVYERPSALPRAYFVPRARLFASPEKVLGALDSPDFDAPAEALLEDAPPQAARDAPMVPDAGAAWIRAIEPERVDLGAKVNTSGYLILTDLFYPGWKAFANGSEVPIYRANYLFRAVPLEPGDWKVRFEYRPASFRIGIAASVTTLLIVLASMSWVARQRMATGFRRRLDKNQPPGSDKRSNTRTLDRAGLTIRFGSRVDHGRPMTP